MKSFHIVASTTVYFNGCIVEFNGKQEDDDSSQEDDDSSQEDENREFKSEFFLGGRGDAWASRLELELSALLLGMRQVAYPLESQDKDVKINFSIRARMLQFGTGSINTLIPIPMTGYMM